MSNNFSEDMKQRIENFANGIKAPNILVVGRVGVGKSSLINGLFGQGTAKTGAGISVTKEFTRYSTSSKDSFLINIYDSAGYEDGREEIFTKNTIKFIDQRVNRGKDEQIHLVWYVVNAASARVTPFDKDIIEVLASHSIPVILVLSQCDRARTYEIEGIKQEFANYKLPSAYETVETSADPLIIGDKPICEPYGLEELVIKTALLLPKIYTDAFVANQMVSIKFKREQAWELIYWAAGGSLAGGFVPIPLTTIGIAGGSLSLLCRELSKYYKQPNINVNEILLQAVFTKQGITSLFIAFVSDLVVGDVFTSIWGGLTAGTFVILVGAALVETFEEAFKLELKGVDKQEVEKFINKIFRDKFQKYKELKFQSQNDFEKFGDSFKKNTW